MKPNVLFLAIFVIFAAFYSFTFMSGGCVKGNGNIIKKNLDYKDFTSVATGISGQVILTQGTNFEVTYEGDSNLLDVLEIDIKNNALNISTGSYKSGKSICPSKDIKFYITMPTLESVAVGGSGSIKSTNDFSCDRLRVAVGGSGDIELRGTANKEEIAIGGSGNVNCLRLKAAACKVAIGGSGDAQVNVTDDLNVAVGGSGTVTYEGNPSIKKSFGGSGKLIKKE